MAGGSATRARVIGNTFSVLRAAVHSRGCEVFTEAMRVRVEAADLYTYLSVVCGEALFADSREMDLVNPLVLVEVLSPSTESYDRTAKWGLYAQIPSLQAYVLIAQDLPSVDVYTRDGDGWRVVQSATGEASIPAIHAVLPLAALYDGVAFPGPGERTRPTPGV